MSRTLKSRVKKLEDPRTPAERQREAEAEHKKRELSGQIEAEYARRAEEWPEGYADLEEAHAECQQALEAAGFDLEQRGDPAAVHSNPAAKKAIRLYRREVERFFHGRVSGGFACERCGRPDSEPGECRHCSGIVSTVR